jgi:hypothetical protein
MAESRYLKKKYAGQEFWENNWILRKNETIVLGTWVLFLIMIYLSVTVFYGCDSGWSVAGWDV